MVASGSSSNQMLSFRSGLAHLRSRSATPLAPMTSNDRWRVSYQDGLRQSDVTLDPIAALRAPTTVLLGVSEPVRAALADVGLQSVFDLATSPLFSLAYEIGEALQGRGPAALARFDTIPGGVATSDGPSRLADFAAAPLTAIRSLREAQATALATALQVDNVADLGRWIPFRSARAILEAAGGVSATAGDEASELVPKLGEFPTERRYYSTVVMDHVVAKSTVDLATAGPVDISPTVDADFGFSAPAVGARLTFEQSWYAHGVTLGNLLHSVALAPGESTRIAVVDWSRQTSASASESIAEGETLVNDTTHNRAVSEVQEAVANEIQTGFSHTNSTSTTVSGGGGFGLSIGPLTVGGSGGAGHTSTSADSFSTSTGSRDLAASMSQQVMDATHQAASSVRNRRASIVKEISESEHESTSTRILANYNHMHALTVQYYEVVELYRVLVGLHEVERCLFVPMKLVDFDDRTVARYQSVLAGAALTRRALELLTTDFGMVRLSAVHTMRPPLVRGGLLSAIGAVRAMARMASPVAPATPAAPADPAASTPPTPTPPPPQPDPTPPAIPDTWDIDEIRRAARITASPVLRADSDSLLLPSDAQLEGISVAFQSAAPLISSIAVRLHSGGAVDLTRTSIGWRVPSDVSLDELQEVAVTTGDGARATGTLTLELSYRGAYFPVTMPIDVAANATAAVARTGDSETGPELVDHLRANKLYYNQAIWRSFDASTVALLLSKFTFEGMPVADLIDPRPLQVAGNYLVFRMPGFVARVGLRTDVDDANTPEAVARRAWNDWLSARGLTFGRESVQEQLVPVPTGGVFAEAVLGRSNSAEKLDATRFWNWQDSPIPLQPPEIAAINMASRAQPVDVTPGQLGQPVLNIVNPTSLPDPTGLGPILGALQNGGMFRDMSGLAATIGLATSTASTAANAATESQKLAAANLVVAAQKDIEEKKIAAQLALAAMGNPAAMQGTPKNHSEMGAMLNTADARDKAKAEKKGTSAAGNGTTGAAGSGDGAGGDSGDGEPDDGSGDGGDSGSGDDGGGGGGNGGGSAGGSGDSESAGDMTFRRAINGLLGDSASNVLLADLKKTAPGASGPAQFSIDTFFYPSVTRGADFSTPAKEVVALQNNQWRPSTQDFRALIWRSGDRQLLDRHMVTTVGDFLRVLAEPSSRFYFVGYCQGDSLDLDFEVKIGGSVSDGSNNTSDPDSSVLDYMTSVALTNVTATRPTDGLGPLLRKVWQRNDDYNRQQGRPDLPAHRELWFATVDAQPSQSFIQGLAWGLRMDVGVLASDIVFAPVYKVSPPEIQMRGRIVGGSGHLTDLHDVGFGLMEQPT
jgi:hypothetical protein